MACACTSFLLLSYSQLQCTIEGVAMLVSRPKKNSDENEWAL